MIRPCIVYHLLSNTVNVVLLANVKSAHVPVADVAEALNSSKVESNFRVSQFGREFNHLCAFGFACLPRRVGVAIQNAKDAHKKVPPADFFRYNQGLELGVFCINDALFVWDEAVLYDDDGAFVCFSQPFHLSLIHKI